MVLREVNTCPRLYREIIWSLQSSLRKKPPDRSGFNICRKWPQSISLPFPKRSFNTLFPLKCWGFGDSLDSHMVPMSPWPLHGGEQEKQMKAVVIRQQELRPARQRSSNAFSQIQSGTWHAKAIFNHWIYFFPIPSSSTSADFTESGQNPNQFQVFRETQKRLFRFMIQARKQNLPLDPTAKFSCFSIEQVKSPISFGQMASQAKQPTECLCPSGMASGY